MAEIEAPLPAEIESVTDLWVELAVDQRDRGSHLLADENRTAVREELARNLVSGGLLVARVDDELAGFVTFGPENDTYRQDVTRGVVHNLYVRSPHRGRGIGSSLLATAEEHLAEIGVDAVSIETMADNDGAQRLYRRHGYTPHRVELEKETETTNHGSGQG